MLARLDCADIVEFVIARSTDYLKRCEQQFDFILLDHAPAGGHRLPGHRPGY